MWIQTNAVLFPELPYHVLHHVEGISDYEYMNVINVMNVPPTFPLSGERQGPVDDNVDLARPICHGQTHFLQASL